MAFDSNAMLELRHVAADRYQRAGGGGAQIVRVSSKAYDDAKGYHEMSAYRQAVYRNTMLWKMAAADAKAGYRWNIRTDLHDLAIDEPFAWPLPSRVAGHIVHNIADTF